MKKRQAALLAAALAGTSTLLLVSVYLPNASLTHATATYEKSVTLLPSVLPTTDMHGTQIVTVDGIPFTIHTSVYQHNGNICFNDKGDAGTIGFPAYDATVSGAHGVGYVSVTFGASVSGNYCKTLIFTSVATNSASSSQSVTLSTSETVTTAFATGQNASGKITSDYTDSKSLEMASLTLTYSCVSA
jgi:hypothetical protein